MISCMICDDDISVHEIIGQIIKLEALPLTIIENAYSGKEAMEILGRGLDIDLIFLDIQMPYYNGFEVMNEYPENKYIIVTAYDYFDYAQKALRLGAIDILLKPIDRAQLAQSIEKNFPYIDTKNVTIKKVISYIDKNYMKDIRVKDLSKMAYMQASNLSRLFKNETGMTITKYIIRTRIAKAKEYLKNTDMNIREICLEVGYNSENLFYKQFKEIEGITPSEYRQKFS